MSVCESIVRPAYDDARTRVPGVLLPSAQYEDFSGPANSETVPIGPDAAALFRWRTGFPSPLLDATLADREKRRVRAHEVGHAWKNRAKVLGYDIESAYWKLRGFSGTWASWDATYRTSGQYGDSPDESLADTFSAALNGEWIVPIGSSAADRFRESQQHPISPADALAFFQRVGAQITPPPPPPPPSSMITATNYPANPKNYTPGRTVDVDQIVLHTMVGTIESARTAFQSSSLSLPRSAHFGVPYNGGDTVECYVSPDDTAWHAGNWPVNQRSIGIEHEDMGNYNDPRPYALYLCSGRLVAQLAGELGIPLTLSNDDTIPGIIPHRAASSTACPDALDVGQIVAIARGEAGVFDPRNNPDDEEYLKQTIRNVVMHEDVAPFALFVALGRYTHNLPPAVQRHIEKLVAATKPKKRKKPTAAQVRAGHGRG